MTVTVSREQEVAQLRTVPAETDFPVNVHLSINTIFISHFLKRDYKFFPKCYALHGCLCVNGQVLDCQTRSRHRESEAMGCQLVKGFNSVGLVFVAYVL